MINTVVVKYGGAAMNDPQAASDLMLEIASLAQEGTKVILVHGGGPEIDKTLRRMGIEPKKIDGLRVTDAETMEVVEMVLAGKVNKHLVSLLVRSNCRAIGFSGRDARMVRAVRKASGKIDLGFVGTVSSIDTKVLQDILKAGFLPVICSVAEDSDGVSLNINADEVAAAIAAEMKVATLVLLTDVPGVLRQFPNPESLIERMTVGETEALLKSGGIDKGMIPKLTSCIDVVKRGVQQVKILDGRSPKLLRQALKLGGFGTTIVP